MDEHLFSKLVKLRGHELIWQTLELIRKYPGITPTDVWVKLRVRDQQLASAQLVRLNKLGLVSKYRVKNRVQYFVREREVKFLDSIMKQLDEFNKEQDNC